MTVLYVWLIILHHIVFMVKKYGYSYGYSHSSWLHFDDWFGWYSYIYDYGHSSWNTQLTVNGPREYFGVKLFMKLFGSGVVSI